MNVASLLWSVLFGSIGLGYFMYGKRQSNMIIRYTGLALMLYPYFVSSTVAMVIVGIVLIFLPKILSRM